MESIEGITAILTASGPWGIVAVLGFLVYRGAARILSLAEAQTAALVQVNRSLEAVEDSLQQLRSTLLADLRIKAQTLIDEKQGDARRSVGK
jgi:hypothetical protein